MPQLSEKWPHLYDGDEPYEFPVGEGWLNICGRTFERIVGIYRKHEIPLGQFAVIQIKEKFGGLRIYTGGIPEEAYHEVEDAIVDAEAESYETCEACGSPGRIRYGNWWRTLCDRHAEEAGYVSVDKPREPPFNWCGEVPLPLEEDK